MKIRKIGNSLGVTGLPKTFSAGDYVQIVKQSENGCLIQKINITPRGE